MSSQDHLALAEAFDRKGTNRRWWLLAAMVAIAVLPLVLQDFIGAQT